MRYDSDDDDDDDDAVGNVNLNTQMTIMYGKLCAMNAISNSLWDNRVEL